jgi:hypothetical protein
MADGGGARPEFERGRGFRWPEAVVRTQGAVGRGVALKRGTGEEQVTEERTASRARFENGRSAVRQRETERERGSGRRSATRCGTASWGLAPTGGQRPATARARKQRGGGC